MLDFVLFIPDYRTLILAGSLPEPASISFKASYVPDFAYSTHMGQPIYQNMRKLL